MPNLDLPVAGYDDPIVGNTDYALPVAAPIDPNIPRVYVNSPGIENRQEQQPILKPVDHDPWSGRNPIKDLVNAASNRKETWIDKTLKEAITGAHDVMSGESPRWAIDPETGDVHTSPQMIEKAQAISALAGTGGLAGADATLGATPFLRPALKYKEKLYKGKEGQQHMDVIPPELYPEFQKMAMSGEDISHYNFGFHNDKGQFLSREKALEYGINTGIIDPQAGKFGALTSTLMADSSKPGTAIEAMAKSRKYMEVRKALDESDPNYVYHITNSERADQIASEGLKLHKPNEFTDQSVWPDGSKDKRNYFTPTAKNSWQFAPEEGKPALLRIKKDSHEFKNESGTGDIYSKKSISPDKIEYLNDEGKWVSLKADSSKEAAAIQSIKAEPFFSALEHNVGQIKQSKMTGDQWLGTLSNKPGVKPEELDWTGLKGFLEENKGKPVTKAQIEEHLAANKVELKEVQKADKIAIDPVVKFIHESLGPASKHITDAAGIADARKFNAHFRETTKGMSDEEVLAAARASEKLEGIGDTKYHSYQLPGGENYREMLLTLPEKPKLTADGLPHDYQLINENAEAAKLGFKIPEGTPERWSFKGPNISSQIFKTREEAVTAALRNAKQQEHTGAYKSSHWDEPNILAHVRMNDRTIDGKKSLHLEEIQSDWHQQGRDKGYKDPKAVAKAEAQTKERARLIDTYGESTFDQALLDRFPADQIAAKELKAYVDNVDMGEIKGTQGVPDAPFKKSWHELALKRMIREAAEKGYDRLSWTPGEAQAARYDLSKSVDKIAVPMVSNSGYSRSVRIDGKDGTSYKLMVDANGKVEGMLSANQFSGKHLSDVVGKEIADKIMKLEKPDEFAGEGLKIGGEGMKGFYDQIIPKALEKLGKEHGVKVKTYEPKKVEASPEEINKLAKTLYETYDRKGGEASWENLHPNKQKHYIQTAKEKAYLVDNPEHRLHYIDIPKSLKDTAMHKGFPLFSKGVPIPLMPIDHDPFKFKPVDGNPFEDDKK